MPEPADPESGVFARSIAMIAAAPRKKVKGEASIRPWRIGTSSGTRLLSWSSSSLTGSLRPFAGSHSP